MRYRVNLILVFFLAAALTGNAQTSRLESAFDNGWKFFKGDAGTAETYSFNDRSWRMVDLPHDWSIEDRPNQSDTVIGPFSKMSIGTTATGYTIGGTGWYRKHFTLDNSSRKNVDVYFDGVYMNSDVWINGHFLGNHPYGYTPFYYDITSYLKSGENVIAVRVRNEGKNSRWYSGSGIYRHVRLISTGPVHVKQWGVWVTTPKVSRNNALVNVKTTIFAARESASLKLVTAIRDSKNKLVSLTETPFITTGTDKEISQDIKVGSPLLWSTGSPDLYQAVTEIKQGDQVLDHVVTTFGIRSIKISADNGFLLNGKEVKLRGGCIHQDNGPLGSTTIDRAEERKIELLKKNGFNAIRTSHNPPSQQLLDACDRLGMIVIDEAFDQWQRAKNPDDYHLYFDEWWKKDLDAYILRDRNHPAVVFWSIGNEINERVDVAGLAIEEKLITEVKRLDQTRPVTEAICSFWDHPGYKWDTTATAYAMLDVGGYNYMWKEYEADHRKYPQRVMMGTESYPKEALVNWNMVEKNPYVLGDFVWTAMDYLGEAGLGHTSLQPRSSPLLQTYPWFNANCGDIDLIGDKKPQMYYRDIVWRTSAMHVMVHTPVPAGSKESVSYWGWPDEVPYYRFPGSEGMQITANIYTRYPEVRLELNGKIISQKKVSADNLTATFNFDYQPGSLKAVALKNGKALDSVILVTAGKPVKIRLTADRKKIKASRNDLAYVTAEVVDVEGHLVPDAVLPLQFTLTGNGEIAATGSANPYDMQSFQKPEHRTFKGKCLIIIRPKGKAGKIRLTAQGVGLTSSVLLIQTH
jgi:beta-galactosidase